MSILSDEYESSKLPQSSRFFNQTSLPDLRTFQLTKNNKSVAFNGQNSNITYNPYNFPQSKTKANFPLDFFHLPNKIHLTGLPNSENPEPQSIPSFRLDDNQAKDPIRFFESVAEEAKEHGAIKVKIPVVQDNLLRSNFQINSDLFWFQSNKLLNNSHEDELKNRLYFHSELIKFHMSQEKRSDTTSGHDELASHDVLEDIPLESNIKEEPELEQNKAVDDGFSSLPEESKDSNILTSYDSKEDTQSDFAVAINTAELKEIVPPSAQTQESHIGMNMIDSQATEADTQENAHINDSPSHFGRNTSISSLLNSPSIQVSNSDNTSVDTASNLDFNNGKSTDTGAIPKPTDSLSSDLQTEQKLPTEVVKDPKKLARKKQIPSFLLKLPMIDKRPIDLYKLFRSVVIRGGFVEVINKKLWAQIGRELGYKGKIMTSLSSSLKSSYQRILYPFESQMGQRIFDVAGLNELIDTEDTRDETISSKGDEEVKINDETNENGKREISSENTTTNKRLKSPLIIGSGIDFQRSVQLKGSKGILVNTPHLIDIKPPISFTVKDEDNPSSKKGKKNQEITESPILPQNQLNHYLSNVSTSPSNSFQDESGLTSVSKIASIYSMRQFMEKDLKFQEFIVQHNASSFNKMSENFPSFYHFNEANMPVPERNFITFDKYEELYWKFISNDNASNPLLRDGLELEHGENLLSLIHGSGFVKIGDDLMNYKNNLNNLNINASSNKIINTANNKIINTFTPSTEGQSVPGSTIGSNLGSNLGTTSNTSLANDVDSFNTDYYISNILQSAMNPWNLHNLPVLPNSLFGALADTDINNQDLINSRINIGMTFSTQNWKCEDHFTQLINYQFFGAHKKWYFIPESEFEKFEALIKEVNENNKDRVSINNCNWAIEELQQLMESNDLADLKGLEYDTLINSLESMINPFQDQRLTHSNSEFDKLIKDQSKLRYNQDFLITPQLLRERDIKYTTSIQKPGEFIVKSPKTYSLSISLGLNFSEEVNFATQTWLPYASEAEDWLSKQSILPNFSVFKLLVNLIQLYDSGKSIGFNSQIYSGVGSYFDDLYHNELEIRYKIRKLKIKESVIDSEVMAESIADDNFANAFPSKIVLTDRSSGQLFILAPKSFLKYHEGNRISTEKFKIEFQLFYSDDKLKNFSRILNGYSIDYEKWTKEYEDMLSENSDLALKVYKSLLNDGERINSAISSANFLVGGSPEEDKKRAGELNKFKNHLQNLRLFIEDSNKFIDECQNLLAIKHHQRIRSGNDFQSSKGLTDLVKLVDRVPTLNFSCAEIDQILEFKAEIENFDKASRVLLSKKNRALKEFDDLIDLGESFGIDIPSLKFLMRIRDRMKWLSRYALIEKGDDPFSDKKEIFTLKHLQQFFDSGLKVLSETDLPKIMELEKILNNSLEFNRELEKILHYETADQLDLDMIKHFVQKFQSEKLFLEMENYNELSKIHLSSKLISQYVEFKESEDIKYSHSDLRALQSSLIESGLKFQVHEIVNKLYSSEEWVYKSWDEIRDKKIVTTLSKDLDLKHLNPKFTLEGRIIDKYYQFLYKNEFNFALEDSHEISSPYLMKFADPDNDVAPTYYCTCREYEFGTMIECDKCNEWYHVVCVNDGEEHHGEEDENYTCPVCQLIDSGNKADDHLKDKLTWTRFKEILEGGRCLKVYPPNELGTMEEVYNALIKHYEVIRGQIEQAKSSEKSVDFRVDLFNFLLRKLYGSGILFEDLLDEVLELARSEDAKLLISKTNNGMQPDADAPTLQQIQPDMALTERVTEVKPSSPLESPSALVAPLSAQESLEQVSEAPTVTATSGFTEIRLPTIPTPKTSFTNLEINGAIEEPFKGESPLNPELNEKTAFTSSHNSAVTIDDDQNPQLSSQTNVNSGQTKDIPVTSSLPPLESTIDQLIEASKDPEPQ